MSFGTVSWQPLLEDLGSGDESRVLDVEGPLECCRVRDSSDKTVVFSLVLLPGVCYRLGKESLSIAIFWIVVAP